MSHNATLKDEKHYVSVGAHLLIEPKVWDINVLRTSERHSFILSEPFTDTEGSQPAEGSEPLDLLNFQGFKTFTGFLKLQEGSKPLVDFDSESSQPLEGDLKLLEGSEPSTTQSLNTPVIHLYTHNFTSSFKHTDTHTHSCTHRSV